MTSDKLEQALEINNQLRDLRDSLKMWKGSTGFDLDGIPLITKHGCGKFGGTRVQIPHKVYEDLKKVAIKSTETAIGILEEKFANL